MNLENDNDIIKIPLFSLPQLGKLSLGFSAVSNTTYWQSEYSCTPDGTDCSYYYNAIPPTYPGTPPGNSYVGFGPSIVPDDIPFVVSDPFVSPESCYQSDHGGITDC